MKKKEEEIRSKYLITDEEEGSRSKYFRGEWLERGFKILFEAFLDLQKKGFCLFTQHGRKHKTASGVKWSYYKYTLEGGKYYKWKHWTIFVKANKSQGCI
ncbi:hypothetical protein LXL04_011471 [Taraxacum kok-saghyz]